MAREILTEEERIRRRNESKQRYAEKKRLEREQAKALMAEQSAEAAMPDYKTMYNKLLEENNLLTAKCAEYEKLCKSFAEREKLLRQNSQNIVTEANAKIQYMLDAAKHAYISMQFAANSSNTSKEAE